MSVSGLGLMRSAVYLDPLEETVDFILVRICDLPVLQPLCHISRQIDYGKAAFLAVCRRHLLDVGPGCRTKDLIILD